MVIDSNLQFIREKIYQVRSAVMYSMSNELVKIPNNIVTALKVDDEGQLWFLSKRPLQDVDQCERDFPARLLFYRKGIPFYLEVSGKATIVNNAFGIGKSEDIAETKKEQPVLIKMSMKNLEYTEPAERRRKNRLELFLEESYKWLLHSMAFHRHTKSVLHKLSRTK
jgi:general stress protein 26